MAGQFRFRWPRPQFSLATFLIFVTLISPCIGYVGHRRAWNVKRKAAIAALQRKGFIYTESRFERATAWSSFNKWLFNEPPLELATSFNNRGYYNASAQAEVTDQDLELLQYLPEIAEVYISSWPCPRITDRGLSYIVALPQLTYLTLHNQPSISGKGFAYLSRNQNLYSVALYDMPNLSSEELGRLTTLRRLAKLEISNCPKLGDEAWRYSRGSHSLKHLKIERCNVGDETLRRLVSNAQLETLTIRANITRDFAPVLASQVSVTELSITNAPLVDEDFAFLSHCRALRELRLNSMPVRGRFLSSLPNPGKLDSLELKSTLLEEQHLAALDRFHRLGYLDLSWCPINGESLPDLGKWKMLTRLSLIGAQFAEAGKAKLLAIHVSSPKVRFDLPSNWVDGDFFRYESEYAWQGRMNLNVTGRFDRRSPARGACYSPKEKSLSEEPLDNFPLDVMAPVLRLHELARAEAKFAKAAGKE